MNAIDDEIIRLRVQLKFGPAKIAQIMQVTEPYIEKAIARLVDEGRIEGGNMAAAASDRATPPSKLPEGDAGYDPGRVLARAVGPYRCLAAVREKPGAGD